MVQEYQAAVMKQCETVTDEQVYPCPGLGASPARGGRLEKASARPPVTVAGPGPAGTGRAPDPPQAVVVGNLRMAVSIGRTQRDRRSFYKCRFLYTKDKRAPTRMISPVRRLRPAQPSNRS